MPREITLETAVETAALTLLEFVSPDLAALAATTASSSSLPLRNKINDSGDDSSTELQNSLNGSIPLLSEGFLENWLPIINQIESKLKELSEKQKLLLEEIKLTNTKLENQDHYEYIALSFSKLPKYLSKLQSIHKAIITISSSTKILKYRANQLKLIKQDQLNQFAKIHERERNFDQTVLAAKVVNQYQLLQQQQQSKSDNTPDLTSNKFNINDSYNNSIGVSNSISGGVKFKGKKNKKEKKEKMIPRREIDFGLSSLSTSSNIDEKKGIN